MWFDQVEIERFFSRAEPGRVAGRRAPVVVEEVGQLGEQDLLQREPGAVEAVRRPARVPVVAHRRDRLALVELGAVREPEHVADPLRVVLDRGDVVAVDAEVSPEVRGDRRAARPHCCERIRIGGVPIAPAARISTLHSMSSIARAGRPGARVDRGALDEVAVGPRRGLADLVDLDQRPHLDPGPLGRGEVVGDHRVLGAEDAARVAPLGVDAAVEVDRQRDAVAGVAGVVERRRPEAARLRDLVPGRLAHAQARLGPAVEGVERAAADLLRPHPPVRPVVGMVVAALEDLASARAARRRGRGWSRRRPGWRRRSARPGPGSGRRRRRGGRRPSTAGSRCGPCARPARARPRSAPRRRPGRARPAARRRSSRRTRCRRCRRRRAQPRRSRSGRGPARRSRQVPARGCGRGRAGAGRRSRCSRGARCPGGPSPGSRRPSSRSRCAGWRRRRRR